MSLIKLFQVNFQRSAFTLIEIIIVLAVLLLSTGIGLSFYNRFNQEKELEAETNKIIDLINLAKKKSLSYDVGQVNESCQFSGYQISFTNNSRYKLQICCGINCSVTEDLNIFNLKLNLSLVNLTYPYAIKFFPTTGETNNNHNIVVKHSLLNKCKQIRISKQAVINVDNITCP